MAQDFGEQLFQLRRRQRLRQKSVARSAGLTPSYLAALEGGRRAAPSQEVVEKLLGALKPSAGERRAIYRSLKVNVVRQAIESGPDLPGADTLVRLLNRFPLPTAQMELLELLIPLLGREISNDGEGEM